jgi:hypothetical protein
LTDEEGKGRVLKTPLLRKELGVGAMKDLEVDGDIEVGDEGEMPPN